MLKRLTFFFLSALAFPAAADYPNPPTNSPFDSSSSASGSAPSSPSEHDWNYASPSLWGLRNPAYAQCALGRQQSPIDFHVSDPLSGLSAAALRQKGMVYEDLSLSPLIFNYQLSNASSFSIGNQSTDPVLHTDSVMNNGHTVELNYEPGSSLTVKNKIYYLRRFHFHSPSEHTVNGRNRDMELHIVHQAEDGEIAVVGIFLEVPESGSVSPATASPSTSSPVSSVPSLSPPTAPSSPPPAPPSQSPDSTSPSSSFISSSLSPDPQLLTRGENNFLDSLDWYHLPQDGELDALHGRLDIFSALPFDLGYYHYEGSLTTPPCTEGVQWYVLKQAVPISEQQKANFVHIFPRSNRPTQPLYNRNVTMTVLTPFEASIVSGVSRDLFLGICGALIIVTLMLVFAVLFICTRGNKHSPVYQYLPIDDRDGSGARNVSLSSISHSDRENGVNNLHPNANGPVRQHYSDEEANTSSRSLFIQPRVQSDVLTSNPNSSRDAKQVLSSSLDDGVYHPSTVHAFMRSSSLQEHHPLLDQRSGYNQYGISP